MTGLIKRIFRRRAADESPRAGVASLFRGRARGERLPGYKRMPTFGRSRLRGRLPWWGAPPAPADPTQQTELLDGAAVASAPSFQDRSRLRRRLRFLRRARELGFRDVGGLIFDMRRFGRNRPDLLDAKLDALLAVDAELRALERVLDDRRSIHELREPGISACARCGALHASEANFCPQCGLQISGPRAMGELGGAIAAPPKAPPIPPQHDWSWPVPPPVDQPTAPTAVQSEPAPGQPTASYVPALSQDDPKPPPAVRDLSADALPEYAPATDSAGHADAPTADLAAVQSAAAAPAAEEKPAKADPPLAKEPRAEDAPAEDTPAEDSPAQQTAPKPPAAKRSRAKRVLTRKRTPAAEPAAKDAPAGDETARAREGEPGEEPTDTPLPPQASGGS